MNSPIEHGGTINYRKRKSARPFDPHLPIHVVLRSEKAKGKNSMLRKKHKSEIEKLLYCLANKYEIKIYEFANSGNHLHLLIRAKIKFQLQNFFREFAGRISLMIYKGKRKFWTSKVYTKIIKWGRHFKNVSIYVIQNNLESLKLIPYQSRNCLNSTKPFVVLDST